MLISDIPTLSRPFPYSGTQSAGYTKLEFFIKLEEDSPRLYKAEKQNFSF